MLERPSIRRLNLGLPFALVAVLLAGCGGVNPPSAQGPSGPATSVPRDTTAGSTIAPDPTTLAGLPGSCRLTGSGDQVLADPACTPGATNPAVTPSTIRSTICVPGWTSTVRPSESVTEELKVVQMRAYGETGRIGSYEEDHLIPLELGGAPADPRNLWPEPGASPNPKDKVESEARRAVCAGTLSLAAAQQAIAGDWITFGRRLASG